MRPGGWQSVSQDASVNPEKYFSYSHFGIFSIEMERERLGKFQVNQPCTTNSKDSLND